MAEEHLLPAPVALAAESFLIRSFQAGDRPQVAQLHAAVDTDCVDCLCGSSLDQIEEQYFRRPQDHFWVAEAEGRIVGTVAICVDDKDVADVHCLRAADASEDYHIRRGLVQVAASHARHHGCLKLVVHARADVARAARFLHRLGFEFSRQREIEQQPVLEFYLNLYQPPELETPGDAAPHHATTDKSA